MRKRTWWLSPVFALLLSGVAVLLRPPQPPASPVTPVAFAEIGLGMTLKEVETILGGPAGNYSSARRLFYDDGFFSLSEHATPLDWKEWVGDEVKVRIGFGPGSKACSMVRSSPMPGEQGRIKEGMTLGQVEAIFGSTGKKVSVDGLLHTAMKEESELMWQVGERTYYVAFGPDGHARATGCLDREVEESPLDRCCRWLDDFFHP